nr:DUF1553 domain-containing protein [Planctomycetota bacterium]
QYYGLQAVFAGVDKAERAYDPDPAVAQQRRELTQRIAELASPDRSTDPSLLEPALHAEIASWEREIAGAAASWIVIDPVTFDSKGGATLTELPDHSLLSGGTRPETDVVTVAAPLPLATVTAVRIELLTDESLPLTGPGRQDNGNLHLNELKLSLADGNDSSASGEVAITSVRADFDQAGWTAAMAIDGNPATAWGIYPEVGKPHHAVFELREPITAGDASSLVVRLEQTHGGGHLIGRFRVSVTSSPAPLSLDDRSFPPEIASVLAIPSERRDETQRMTLAAFYVRQKLEVELASLPPRQKVYVGTNQFAPDGSFKPAEQPRVVHTLHRGDIHEPREEATPAALACLEGLDPRLPITDPQDEGQRRAAFAHWLSDHKNVLVWRSIVNRTWQRHFGEGLVASPNDFGRMGSTPSHRELLDWLTFELIRSGGSLKHLHRLIVTSATYRQASTHNEQHAAIDASNRLLWRMNRTRLDAESVRDAALVFSGELDQKMGGPSVKNFIETPGIHVTPNVDYRTFDPDDAANRRRGVYRFLFRTLPDPFMETLDCPDGSRPTGARTESVTALQAFAMLNDPFIVRRSEHLAARLEGERPDRRGQIDRLYELMLLRDPSEEERSAFVEFASRHGVANACRMLLNSNEFLFAD